MGDEKNECWICRDVANHDRQTSRPNYSEFSIFSVFFFFVFFFCFFFFLFSNYFIHHVALVKQGDNILVRVCLSVCGRSHTWTHMYGHKHIYTWTNYLSEPLWNNNIALRYMISHYQKLNERPGEVREKDQHQAHRGFFLVSWHLFGQCSWQSDMYSLCQHGLYRELMFTENVTLKGNSSIGIYKTNTCKRKTKSEVVKRPLPQKGII